MELLKFNKKELNFDKINSEISFQDKQLLTLDKHSLEIAAKKKKAQERKGFLLNKREILIKNKRKEVVFTKKDVFEERAKSCSFFYTKYFDKYINDFIIVDSKGLRKIAQKIIDISDSRKMIATNNQLPLDLSFQHDFPSANYKNDKINKFTDDYHISKNFKTSHQKLFNIYKEKPILKFLTFQIDLNKKYYLFSKKQYKELKKIFNPYPFLTGYLKETKETFLSFKKEEILELFIDRAYTFYPYFNILKYNLKSNSPHRHILIKNKLLIKKKEDKKLIKSTAFHIGACFLTSKRLLKEYYNQNTYWIPSFVHDYKANTNKLYFYLPTEKFIKYNIILEYNKQLHTLHSLISSKVINIFIKPDGNHFDGFINTDKLLKSGYKKIFKEEDENFKFYRNLKNVFIKNPSDPDDLTIQNKDWKNFDSFIYKFDIYESGIYNLRHDLSHIKDNIIINKNNYIKTRPSYEEKIVNLSDNFKKELNNMNIKEILKKHNFTELNFALLELVSKKALYEASKKTNLRGFKDEI